MSAPSPVVFGDLQLDMFEIGVGYQVIAVYNTHIPHAPRDLLHFPSLRTNCRLACSRRRPLLRPVTSVQVCAHSVFLLNSGRDCSCDSKPFIEGKYSSEFVFIPQLPEGKRGGGLGQEKPCGTEIMRMDRACAALQRVLSQCSLHTL